jgi:hypothetical protein
LGYRISWYAFHGLTKPEVLELLEGVDTGVPDEANEAPFSFAELPNGWFILFSNDFGLLSEELLAMLSARGLVVGCQVHENLMISLACAYERGAFQWMLTHNSDQGRRDLGVYGSPPPEFAEIRDRLMKEQEDDGGDRSIVDFYFDIPVETARSLSGYRYDRGKYDWGEPVFTVLEVSKNLMFDVGLDEAGEISG